MVVAFKIVSAQKRKRNAETASYQQATQKDWE